MRSTNCAFQVGGERAEAGGKASTPGSIQTEGRRRGEGLQCVIRVFFNLSIRLQRFGAFRLLMKPYAVTKVSSVANGQEHFHVFRHRLI